MAKTSHGEVYQGVVFGRKVALFMTRNAASQYLFYTVVLFELFTDLF